MENIFTCRFNWIRDTRKRDMTCHHLSQVRLKLKLCFEHLEAMTGV